MKKNCHSVVGQQTQESFYSRLSLRIHCFLCTTIPSNTWFSMHYYPFEYMVFYAQLSLWIHGFLCTTIPFECMVFYAQLSLRIHGFLCTASPSNAWFSQYLVKVLEIISEKYGQYNQFRELIVLSVLRS